MPSIGARAPHPCAVFTFFEDGTLSAEQRFDPSGLVLLTRSWQRDGGRGSETLSEYDAFSRPVLRRSSPPGTQTRWQYDDASRPLRVQTSLLDGGTPTDTWWTYGAFGVETRVELSADGGTVVREEWDYDGGRLNRRGLRHHPPLDDYWEEDSHSYEGGRLTRIRYRRAPAFGVYDLLEDYGYEDRILVHIRGSWDVGSELWPRSDMTFAYHPDGGLKTRIGWSYGFVIGGTHTRQQWSEEGQLVVQLEMDLADFGTDRAWYYGYEDGRLATERWTVDAHNPRTTGPLDVEGIATSRYAGANLVLRTASIWRNESQAGIHSTVRTSYQCDPAWPLEIDFDDDNDGRVDGLRSFEHDGARAVIVERATGSQWSGSEPSITVTHYGCRADRP